MILLIIQIYLLILSIISQLFGNWTILVINVFNKLKMIKRTCL